MNLGSEPQRSSGQDILLPTPKTKDRRKRSLIVEINSRDRNVQKYPNPSEFRWRFQRPLKDIYSMQIVGGTIPTRVFNIDVGWNQFTFQEGTTKYTVTIAPGRYTMSLFSVELAARLNALVGISNTYSASVSSTSDQLTITSDVGVLPFSFFFATGSFVDLFDANNTLLQIYSPRKLMGFLKQDYSDGGSGKITSPYAMDLEFLLNRFYLFINHDNNQDLGTIERSVGRNNPHSIIYMDMNEQTYKTFSRDTFEPLFISSPAPIARISTLDIALRDEFDRLINLNNRDFTLLLEILYFE
jgi:hypothetical protein